MRDYSPLAHAAMAITLQCGLGLSLSMWGADGAIGCIWFIAREHTQAEYRWIAQLGGGKRVNMPWWAVSSGAHGICPVYWTGLFLFWPAQPFIFYLIVPAPDFSHCQRRV